MRTVLIADSDSFQRQLIDMLLAVDNYHLRGFGTGKALLEHLQNHVPDLVILDYALPDINGADLCAKMKKVRRLANVPVILVTAAHKLELVRGVATAVRADLVLAKPLGDKHLREQVLKLLKPSVKSVPQATPIHVDPILEQALETIQSSPSQTLSPLLSSPTLPPIFSATSMQGFPSLSEESKRKEKSTFTPVFIDRDESTPFQLEVPNSLTVSSPVFPSTSGSQLDQVFQADANAALEALLGEPNNGEPENAEARKNAQDLEQHVLDAWNSDEVELADTDGAISEQELLESLKTPFVFPEPTSEHPLEIEPDLPEPVQPASVPLKPPPFTDTPAPEFQAREPRAVPLASKQLEPLPQISDFHSSLDQTLSGIEAEMQALRSHVEQLSIENERLRKTLLELSQGQSLTSTKSYLDAVEELELLRRLSDIQVKQLDSLQRQNQRLLEESQGNQERKRGLFRFLQPKNPS
jgi:DNA-binding response OmpR family regulator